ncbi:SGNH/GDSL hydrolase family protein [Roseibacterium beibuensis]|uniref:autotransporter domain-containing protein n=1 Tax=[Roseibacterium] beibuensis TaxID=1193142 RepID=UPI00217D91DF|nr:autotransporter domain-containing protein [Roseibacterium beibuensis]MCS6624800.1 SGNH/GDSL hydrolase family protein [Roseibacterium beibuensis]
MSRFLRNAAAAALAVAAVGAFASTASAQSYGRLVVFGDSLSDNGNLYTLLGQPTSPPYYQGRFSNGPVFTELLGFNAGLYAQGAPVTGSVNYAFGGARTDNAALPPGMRNQLLAYTGAGGTFGSNDLVSILGGANNIFQAFPAAAGNPATAQATMQAVATGAAADINFIVNSVAGAGAGTILVTNLPRLGITPQFSASNPLIGPAGSALADFSGTTFNSALSAGLFGVAAANPNSNIILMDLYKISDPLAGNPGLFGLTNATDSCFNGVTVCADPDSYLYWDGVHPTAAGHRLIAMLANDYLYYGDLGAQSTVQAETGFRQREDLLDLAGEGLSARGAWEAGTNLTFGALYDSVETDARGVVAAADATGWGGRVGLDHVMSDTMRFGMAGTFRTADVEAGPMAFDVQSYAFDIYAGWRADSLFVNATVGGSIDKYDDITRVTALAPIVHSGETDGVSLGARVQAGTWFDMGGIALSPRVAVNFVSTDVDGYVEQGVAAQYEYQDRTVQAGSGEVSLRAEGGGDGMSFWVEGGYRDSFGDSSDAVRVGIAGNPAQVLEREFADPFGGSVIASAGLQTDVGPGTISVGYRGRFGDAADSHVGAVTFRLPLP